MTDQAVDMYLRDPFARRLAQLLVAPQTEGSVIGLIGEWGSGKTWIFARTAHHLSSLANPPIVLVFNPWELGQSEPLIGHFLARLAAELRRELEKDAPRTGGWLRGFGGWKEARRGTEFAQSLLKYAALLGHLRHVKYFPGLAGVGMAFEEGGKAAKALADDIERVLPKTSIGGLKREIDDAIQRELQGRLVVVMIDDLDRLRHDEIVDVVRMVKAVANFTGVRYLLAYDRRYVAQALAQPQTNLASGYAFLEKIVPLEVPVPAAMPWQLLAQIRAIAESGPLSVRERELLDEAVDLAGRLVRHPRDLDRLRARLAFVRDAPEPINFCDLMVLEALVMRFPSLAEAVAQRPEEFTLEDVVRDSHGTFGVKYIDAPGFRERYLRSLPGDERERELAQRALQFLFPRVSGVHYAEAAPGAGLRVSSIVNLKRWSTAQGFGHAFEPARLIAALAEPDEMRSLLRDMLPARPLEKWSVNPIELLGELGRQVGAQRGGEERAVSGAIFGWVEQQAGQLNEALDRILPALVDLVLLLAAHAAREDAVRILHEGMRHRRLSVGAYLTEELEEGASNASRKPRIDTLLKLLEQHESVCDLGLEADEELLRMRRSVWSEEWTTRARQLVLQTGPPPPFEPLPLTIARLLRQDDAMRDAARSYLRALCERDEGRRAVLADAIRRDPDRKRQVLELIARLGNDHEGWLLGLVKSGGPSWAEELALAYKNYEI